MVTFRLQKDTGLQVMTKEYPLHEAIKSNNQKEIDNILHERSQDAEFLNQRDSNGLTPLMVAAKRLGKESLTKLLDNEHVDVNARVENTENLRDLSEREVAGSTALNIIASDPNNAISQKHAEKAKKIAEKLLEKGANPNIPDALRNTPLHNAASQEKTLLVKSLMEKGADQFKYNMNGKTPKDIAQDSIKRSKMELRDALNGPEREYLNGNIKKNEILAGQLDEIQEQRDNNTVNRELDRTLGNVSKQKNLTNFGEIPGANIAGYLSNGDKRKLADEISSDSRKALLEKGSKSPIDHSKRDDSTPSR